MLSVYVTSLPASAIIELRELSVPVPVPSVPLKEPLISVSYTHLDVYKRQGITVPLSPSVRLDWIRTVM